MSESQPADPQPQPTGEPTIVLAGREYPRSALEASARGGSSWYYWIAGLSVLNTLASHFQWGFAMVIGLGITQVIDAVAMFAGEDPDLPNGAVVQGIALGLSLFVAAGFACIGYLATKRYVWAYILGMVLYLLDALLFLVLGDWLSVGFHAFVLFMLWGGLAPTRALNAVDRAERLAAMPDPNVRQIG